MQSTVAGVRPKAVAYPFTGVGRRSSLRCCAKSTSGSSSDPIQRPPYVPNRIDDPNYVSSAGTAFSCLASGRHVFCRFVMQLCTHRVPALLCVYHGPGRLSYRI